MCWCLCCTSLLLSLLFLMLLLPPLPWLCHHLEWARQQQHTDTLQTYRAPFSFLLCELGPWAGLAGQYKPDIRFMLLALWVTAGSAFSPKLLAVVGELLARIKLDNIALIFESPCCVFVMAVYTDVRNIQQACLGFSSASRKSRLETARTTGTVYLDLGFGYCRSLMLILLFISSKLQKYWVMLNRFWPGRSLVYPKIGKPDEIISVPVLGL